MVIYLYHFHAKKWAESISTNVVLFSSSPVKIEIYISKTSSYPLARPDEIYNNKPGLITGLVVS
jgi:hypothetical protein